MQDFKDRKIIGLTEKILIKGNNDYKKEIVARIDTGATKSSIDRKLVEDLDLGPVFTENIVRSANGRTVRPVIKVNFVIKGKEMNSQFTVADRSHLNYQVLIGQNVLKKGFIIDPLLK